MSPIQMTNPSTPSRLHRWFFGGERWIPLLFVLFFVAIFAVMGNFVRLAHTTFPGLVTANAYESGLAYDDLLAAEAEQIAQGWQMQVYLPALSGPGQAIAMRLTDSNGQPLSGGTVIVMAERMTRYAQQFRLSLTDEGNGLYQAPITFPIAGRWFVSVLADINGARHFETHEIYLDAPGVN